VTPHRPSSLDLLLTDVRACRVCAPYLPLGPRPVVRAKREARILIVGQAPGARVHASGIPWDDASGKRLRDWLGIDSTTFYDESQIAIIPMGFCYPGRGAGGDKPPRPECAPLWMDRLLAELPEIELTLLIGQYAQRRFLGSRSKSSLTDTVAAWAEYAPAFIPLPHPSPRNQAWFQRHPWFASDVLPMLRRTVEPLAIQDSARALSMRAE
jgi:uracil-DNA glycosylase